MKRSSIFQGKGGSRRKWIPLLSNGIMTSDLRERKDEGKKESADEREGQTEGEASGKKEIHQAATSLLRRRTYRLHLMRLVIHD